jgi:hypothetical protein
MEKFIKRSNIRKTKMKKNINMLDIVLVGEKKFREEHGLGANTVRMGCTFLNEWLKKNNKNSNVCAGMVIAFNPDDPECLELERVDYKKFRKPLKEAALDYDWKAVAKVWGQEPEPIQPQKSYVKMVGHHNHAEIHAAKIGHFIGAPIHEEAPDAQDIPGIPQPIKHQPWKMEFINNNDGNVEDVAGEPWKPPVVGEAGEEVEPIKNQFIDDDDLVAIEQ